jgi:hypothetical protein
VSVNACFGQRGALIACCLVGIQAGPQQAAHLSQLTVARGFDEAFDAVLCVEGAAEWPRGDRQGRHGQ